VFSVDENSQRRALDRAQRGLPLKKGHCGTMTHNNHCTKFAAFDIGRGKVIGQYMPQHRANATRCVSNCRQATHKDTRSARDSSGIHGSIGISARPPPTLSFRHRNPRKVACGRQALKSVH
jgi:hypothetical protein